MGSLGPLPGIAVCFRIMTDLSIVLDLLIAALVGLAVGSEREWSGHTRGPDGRFAGLRTFGMLGAIGGLGGWFYRDGFPAVAVPLVAAAALFPVAAYVSAMRRPGTTADGTTEVAAMVVVALGFAAGTGHRTIASAAAALLFLLLAEKSAMHRVLHKVGDVEVRAAAQFAVLALVVLPLLPSGAYGPWGAFEPRALWIVVLLFSGLNFVGYVARRVIGETQGLAVTGLLGGMVSSTAVTLTFSRRSRVVPSLSQPLAIGVIAACTMLLPRIALVTALLRPAVAMAALPVLVPPFVLGALLIARAIWRARAEHGAATVEVTQDTAERLHNPLALATSLQMAVAFQLVLFVIAFIQQRVGAPGVLASATLLGLTDMDALTLSMTRLAIDPQFTTIAARAIGIGILSNSALKIAVALTLGAPGFRLRVAAGLAALAAATAAGLWFMWA